jgi:hypothetical protein
MQAQTWSPNTSLEPTRTSALGLPEGVWVCLCFWAAWLSFEALGVFAHHEFQRSR